MLGWKPAERAAPSFAEFAAMAPPGLTLAPAGDIGMPAPVFDTDALRRRNQARLAQTGASL